MTARRHWRVPTPQLAGLLLLLGTTTSCQAFVPRAALLTRRASNKNEQKDPVTDATDINNHSCGCIVLRMAAMDPVTYLRTEWVSAALCTNQTPRSADVCLQLGTQDGRAVTFIPRTIRQLITSSPEKDGKLTLSARRQLKQAQERRGAATVQYVDQAADDLSETDDESVDVVISLQAAERMLECGQDWKASVREAARVLKPGGRLLWVEPASLKGESYIDYVENLAQMKEEPDAAAEDAELFPVFDDIGYDDIDLVLIPHTAGLAIKSVDAGLSLAERTQKVKQAEDEKLAEISIQAYERGLKKKKRKKRRRRKQKDGDDDGDD